MHNKTTLTSVGSICMSWHRDIIPSGPILSSSCSLYLSNITRTGSLGAAACFEEVAGAGCPAEKAEDSDHFKLRHHFIHFDGGARADILPGALSFSFFRLP
jgi:hypothetical protein